MDKQEVRMRTAAIRSEIDQGMTAVEEILDARPIFETLFPDGDPAVDRAFEAAERWKSYFTEMQKLINEVEETERDEDEPN